MGSLNFEQLIAEAMGEAVHTKLAEENAPAEPPSEGQASPKNPIELLKMTKQGLMELRDAQGGGQPVAAPVAAPPAQPAAVAPAAADPMVAPADPAAAPVAEQAVTLTVPAGATVKVAEALASVQVFGGVL